MPRLPLLFAGPILAAFPAFAQVPAAEALYEIDARHSHVQFSVRRFGFNAILGEFRDFGGTVTLRGEALGGGRASVTIATASVVTGDAERDAIVKGGHWLDVARYPAIEFHVLRVAQLDPGSATVTGLLTLHGVTRPILVDATLNRRGIDPSIGREAVGFSATAALRRSEFGMRTAPELIGDDVRIRIEAIAHLRN